MHKLPTRQLAWLLAFTPCIAVCFVGHGLDWVWPFLLGYPQEKIAIINDICVVHPKKELQPGSKLTIYKEHNPHAEHVAVLAKFGYESEVSALQPIY